MVTFPLISHSQRAILAISFVFSILTAITVLLRFISHRIARRALSASDYCILGAAVFAIALQSISITAVFHGGLGWGHATDLVAQYGQEPLVVLLKLIVPLQFMWALSLSLSKTSILLFYLRVFEFERYIQLTAKITIAVIAMWASSTIIAGCLICVPFAMNWSSVPGGHCGNQVVSFILTGTINLITDLVVLVLPLRALHNLQMPKFKKIVIITVFSLGAVYVLLKCFTTPSNHTCTDI